MARIQDFWRDRMIFARSPRSARECRARQWKLRHFRVDEGSILPRTELRMVSWRRR